VKKLALTEWAAAGEIVGTVAVVISLLFVAHSINRNTDATYASSENLIFERHTELANQFMLDPTLAELLVRRRNGDVDLSDVEAVRWEKYQLNLLDIWAMAYDRHQRDLLGEDQWLAWDRYFTHTFSYGGEAISKNRWQELEYGFAQDFWEHVGAVLFERENGRR